MRPTSGLAGLMVAIVGPALARSVPALAGALLLVGATNSAMDLSMNAQGVSVERHLRRPILSSLHAAFSFGGFAALGLGLAGVVPTLFRAGADQPGVSTGPALSAVTALGYLGFLAGPPLIGGIAQLTSLRAACAVLVLAGLLVVVLAGAAAVPARDEASLHRGGAGSLAAGSAALP